MLRLIDNVMDDVKATVSYCGDCEDKTVHLQAEHGVEVCADCGYNPLWDLLTDDADFCLES